MDDIETVKQLLLKLAVIGDRLDTRSEQAVQGVEACAAALDQRAHRLESGADQFAQQALRTIDEQAQQTIAGGVERAIASFETRLHHSAERASRTTDALAEQHKRLAGAQKALVFAGLASLLVGLTLAIGGTWLWVNHSREQVAQLQVEARLLSAINAADIVLCADGQLCVNVDDLGKRQGDQRQYQPVKQR